MDYIYPASGGTLTGNIRTSGISIIVGEPAWYMLVFLMEFATFQDSLFVGFRE